MEGSKGTLFEGTELIFRYAFGGRVKPHIVFLGEGIIKALLEVNHRRWRTFCLTVGHSFKFARRTGSRYPIVGGSKWSTYLLNRKLTGRKDLKELYVAVYTNNHDRSFQKDAGIMPVIV